MKRTVVSVLLVLAITVLVLPVCGQAAVLYVKSGGTGNGSSWSAAAGSIDAAMNVANVGDQIWVAAVPLDPSSGIDFYYLSGTYIGTGIGEILVKDGVSIYGGFNGTETSLTQRNPAANVTKLLLQMRIRMLQDSPTVIDGFTFLNGVDFVFLIGDTGSAGTCGSLTISNNIFKNGGAPAGSIYTYPAPFICNATIQKNTFYPGSKPIYIPNGAPKVLNNLLTERNLTSREGISIGSGGATSTGAVVANNFVWGMGVTINSSGVLVANNTVIGGSTGPTMTNMYGIIVSGGDTIVNNIVGYYGNGIYSYDFITAHNNLVYGNGVNYGGSASPGAGDIQSDPRLVDRLNGDLHLTGTSPALNAGDNSVLQAGWTDFDGNPRVYPTAGIVDIGGDEYGSTSGPANSPPVVGTPTANPNPVTGQTTQLSVVASDSDGDTLTYQWALPGSAPAVSYSNQFAPTTSVTFPSAGSYTFQVTVNDGHGNSVTSSPVTVTVGSVTGVPASVVAYSGTPQSTTVGSLFAGALQAKVMDASSNPVSGVTVTFTAPGSGASESFNGSLSATAVTNSSGIATSPTPTANSIAGSYTVVASVTGLTSASFALTNTSNVVSTGAVSIFPSTAIPTTFNVASNPIELGVRFRSDVGGNVTGIRFYKGAGDSSVHTGSLWTTSGTLLATGTFSGETGSGWQQLSFSAPVAITANTVYIASYHTGGDFYYSYNYYQSSGVDNPPLHALQDGAGGPNGVYVYGSGGVFPTQSYSSSNYWVDVLFQSGSTAPPPTGATTIFSSTAIPTTFNVASNPIELGVRFRSDVNGNITGIRFYKGAGDSSVHTGSLWTSSGTLLATGTFSGETGSGWQQLNFSAPVAITANTVYIASYHTGGDFYYSYNYFQSSGVDNPPLHALQVGAGGPDGVYVYGSGGVFPNQSYLSSNYWVDVVFSQQ